MPSTSTKPASVPELPQSEPDTSQPQTKAKAAVIDDAFDPILEGEILIEQFLVFQQTADEQSFFDDFLTNLGREKQYFEESDVDSPDLIDYLNFLWENREYNNEVNQLVIDLLFNAKQEKVRDLASICSNLTQAGLDIKEIGSTQQDFSIFQDGSYVYVFLDYNLGPVEGTKAVKKAERTAREIYEKCPAEKKPVTILMSSNSNAAKAKEDFRENAGLLEGVFRYSNKENLKNEGKVSLLVRSYYQEFKSNHELQSYIQTLSIAAEKALARFKEEIKILRIDDYIFMQNSALIEDEQPLGDYLAWLYGSRWGNLLLQDADLKRKQDTIDRIVSKISPLHHDMPSSKLAEIYMNALFETELDDVEAHPFRAVEVENGASAEDSIDYPYLHLGDVFTNEESLTLWMIINAQCDLERPKKGFADRSILLIPGELEPLKQVSTVPTPPRTELFLFNEKPYRIAWKEKKVRTIEYEKINEWRTTNGWKRNHRLKLPFALEIQQAFSNGVTRVGLPVSPPFTQVVTVQVLMGKHGQEPTEILPKGLKYAFMPVTKKEDKTVRLTLDFALDFKDAINEKCKEYESKKAELLADGKSVVHVETLLNNFTYMLNNFDDWFLKNRGFKTPVVNKFPDLIPKLLLTLQLISIQ